ncbi:MAG TPA: alpha/beta hydrolase [Caulobacteraceae bacterium]|jgi:pimeloyl-ACP methyl ester carboxylesterase
MTLSGVKRTVSKEGRRPRPRGVLAIGWACLETAVSGRTEHRPTSVDYSEDVVRRITFTAGGGFGWRISALSTPRPRPAPWKIVVITGAPSWAEYWAPVMAALPQDREMVVVDRPGYGASEPEGCVPDIRDQARALAPLLDGPRGQKIVLVGQSYGAAIATLMAAARPRRLATVVLVSSYLGESGPTARRLVGAGSRLKGVIPRDLRHAVIEVSGQPPQMPLMHGALARLNVPIHVIHGDADDFAPIELARRLAAETKSRRPISFRAVAEANHFLNDQPVETVISCLEACLPRPAPSAPELIGRFASGLAGRLGTIAGASRGIQTVGA